MAKARVTQSREELREKRIANLKPYKPGQSGNPGGRPKKEPIKELYEELYNDPEYMDLVRTGLRSTAKKGSIPLVMHLKDAAERLEGKVTQKVDVELNVALSIRVKKAFERIGDE